MRFYVGLHQPSDAQHFGRACISIKRIVDRRSPFQVGAWMMDSGAFTELAQHGRYRHTVAEYAHQAARWVDNGRLDAVVAQDYMCEPFILDKTGLTVAEHQRLTIDRYDELADILAGRAYVLPVLQGFAPDEYRDHLRAYGDRLTQDMWVGVGSVCKRQGNPSQILRVVDAVRARRPDLRLHGFGVKLTSLRDHRIRQAFWSADSMAWSYAARKQGRDGNSWREAEAFRLRIETERGQRAFDMVGAS